ncbi:hypothetical protein [Aminipila luticellarii]|uniref:Uncharacterized protein n=1 Tax=Aminipila luticellarii TaxID=2507160 RepID=A0A410PX35_9FIRM|nr:hypothetical protein [Aminipila luticellarii]QAT43464.1 hypothetical protein EQM06_09685 [Aminipila luticellarii]
MTDLRLFIDNEERETIPLESATFMVVKNGDMGAICCRDRLRYLKLDEKHVISQGYIETIKQLAERYSPYLYQIWPEQICICIDEAWEPSEKANPNSSWKIDIQKAPLWLRLITNFEYMIKMRQHWIDKWSEAQLNAAIMSQLLRINPKDGNIYKYTEDFHSRLVATFGLGYLEPNTVIPNLLGEEEIKLHAFKIASGQISMDEVMANQDEGDEGDDEEDGEY